jgi:hypothetical protein
VSHSSTFLRSIADFMSVRRYSRCTISTHLYWIKSFIIYHHKRHPEAMHDVEVEHYLTDLAANKSLQGPFDPSPIFSVAKIVAASNTPEHGVI